MSFKRAAHTVAHIIRKRHMPVWFELGFALMCETCDLNLPGRRRTPPLWSRPLVFDQFPSR